MSLATGGTDIAGMLIKAKMRALSAGSKKSELFLLNSALCSRL